MKKKYENFFSVVALILCAIFSQNSNAQCSGSVASGAMPFSYSFKTETDGSITGSFTLVNNQPGLVVHLFKYNAAGTGEVANFVIPNAGMTWTKNFTVAEAAGANIKLRAEFVWADGGYFTTPTYDFVVGSCGPVVTDTEKPVGFTATVGAITPTSIEVLLNGTDNSGTVIYNITGGASAEVTGVSGTPKSFIIENLAQETAFNFSVTAKDAAGNTALNNPIALSATTTKDSTTPCAGSVATGAMPFSYSFKTETDGSITGSFTLVNNQTGLVVHLFKYNAAGTGEVANFAIPNAGMTWTKNFTVAEAAGANIKLRAEFVWADGGYFTTPTYDYTVGDNCGPVVVNDTEKPVGFTATVGAITPTSIEVLLNGTDNSGTVIYNITGGATAEVTGVSGTPKSFVIENLAQETAFNFSVTAKDAAGNTALNNPIALSATTTKDSTTPCAGSVATGAMPFSYSFKTETDGSITGSFTLVNNQTGLVVHLFKYNAAGTGEVANFAIPNAGMTWKKNFTVAEAAGANIKLRAEFVWADGGYFTTPTYDYTVGDACTALGIDDAELSGNDIILYPNPVKGGIVNVEVGALTVSKVEVYSLLGAKVLETSKTAISTANLQAGIYFVKISAEGKSITKKLIVN